MPHCMLYCIVCCMPPCTLYCTVRCMMCCMVCGMSVLHVSSVAVPLDCACHIACRTAFSIYCLSLLHCMLCCALRYMLRRMLCCMMHRMLRRMLHQMSHLMHLQGADEPDFAVSKHTTPVDGGARRSWHCHQLFLLLDMSMPLNACMCALLCNLILWGLL